MGLTTLPNGMEFFSISEELEVFTEFVYEGFTPLNIVIMTALTGVFIAFIITLAFIAAKKQIEAVHG